VRELIQNLLRLPVPLPDLLVANRANCFNAIQLYWNDTADLHFVGPEEFLTYIKFHFTQIKVSLPQQAGDVAVIWSRSSDLLPVGSIRIEELQKERQGYPFGLIIEHSFVIIGNELVFQKRDPSLIGPYESVPGQIALKPYFNLNGFEVTRHRRL